MLCHCTACELVLITVLSTKFAAIWGCRRTVDCVATANRLIRRLHAHTAWSRQDALQSYISREQI